MRIRFHRARWPSPYWRFPRPRGMDLVRAIPERDRGLPVRRPPEAMVPGRFEFQEPVALGRSAPASGLKICREPLRTMPATGLVVNRSTGDGSDPSSRSATGQRGVGVGRRAQVVGIRLRVQRLQRLRVHPGRALRKETESDQGPGVAASPVRRPGPRACHQPVPQWARRRVDDNALGVSEDSAGRRRPSAWVPQLRRVKKICRERLYPVTPRKAVKPSCRCAGHAPQGAGELPGYGSHVSTSCPRLTARIRASATDSVRSTHQSAASSVCST